MPNTPIAALPAPSLSDAPNGPAQVLALATALDDKIVPRFATTTARDAAITAPVAGQMCWTTTPAGHWFYNGSTWIWLGRAGLRVRRVANQSLTTATATAVLWDTEDEDTHGFITPTSSTVTIPAGLGGVYAITSKQILGTTPGANRTFLEIAVTSVLTGMTSDWRAPQLNTNESGRIVVSATLRLDPTDSFVINSYQGTGGSVNVTAYLSCFRVSL